MSSFGAFFALFRSSSCVYLSAQGFQSARVVGAVDRADHEVVPHEAVHVTVWVVHSLKDRRDVALRSDDIHEVLIPLMARGRCPVGGVVVDGHHHDGIGIGKPVAQVSEQRGEHLKPLAHAACRDITRYHDGVEPVVFIIQLLSEAAQRIGEEVCPLLSVGRGHEARLVVTNRLVRVGREQVQV
jgi:hypothetical protein